ncbi:hypothetical protein HETIRDRAFT_107306 [Heterobasidion irregulare TC 32-1]|uniref:Uncharacterized protein n=1 Tax=Heterobasidion irregulare (strain TC 32-1) TaxID=747525 RepID=W4KBG8_HETIT|nr:uncharacterized protein HETIRDRAFT_107306 [Heterobasidion irregulare TC 32-1]ETW83192.1 hypothetical protein HETIRDRAFT_107306 [Heterobasidion irregulare TC 32-1]
MSAQYCNAEVVVGIGGNSLGCGATWWYLGYSLRDGDVAKTLSCLSMAFPKLLLPELLDMQWRISSPRAAKKPHTSLLKGRNRTTMASFSEHWPDPASVNIRESTIWLNVQLEALSKGLESMH